ncbi:MAG: luciferase family protein [Chloroflexota bacterium]
MSNLRDELVKRLEASPNVKVALWKDTDLLCVFHKDKEIAHFQNDCEIDIRLTPAIIKQQGLRPPQNTTSHLDRSKNSRWIV